MLYLFGAGKNGKRVKKICTETGCNVEGFIDNKLCGEYIDGIKICALSDLENKNIFIIITVMDMEAIHDICDQLQRYGFIKGRNYIVWREIEERIQGSNRDWKKYPNKKRKIIELYNELQSVYKKFVFPDMTIVNDIETIELMFGLIGTGNAEAIYIRYYLNQTLQLKGDICEFGIAQGATSALLANEIREIDKRLWLFDSFEGLSVPTSKDILKDDIFHYGSMEKYAHSMKCSMDEVCKRMKNIGINEDKICIISGFIENTVKQKNVNEELSQICFAYVDFDLYEPILTALEFINERSEKGCVIIVDDYDFFSTGAKTAVDEFVFKYGANYSLKIPVECAGHFAIIERI